MYEKNTILWDHFKEPRYEGKLNHCHHRIFGKNPLCGDEITITCLKSEAGWQANYQTKSCMVCTASASLLMTMINESQSNLLDNIIVEFLNGAENKPLVSKEFANFWQTISKYPVRHKCALLPWKTWQDYFLTRDPNEFNN
tara:strand:- start:363 stop:785 length:423 start_codon:yes stop_codon:yes gene_type:complete